MSRTKPQQCFDSQCPLAVTCGCGHMLEEHPEDKKCTHTNGLESCLCLSFKSKGKGFVLGVGDPSTAPLAIILEAPGNEEIDFPLDGPGAPGIIPPDELERRLKAYPQFEPRFRRVGAPVVGKSGSILNQWILPKAGLLREEIYIDNTLRCFGGDTLVSAEGIRKAYRRWYVGPMLTIKTDKHSLTGTPNHPIFTSRGLIPLQELQEGDELFCNAQDIGLLPVRNPKIHNAPIPFEKLFASLSDSGISVGTIGRMEDFHGDGAESQIDIVWPQGKLWDRIVSQISHRFSNLLFKLASKGAGFFQRFSSSVSHANDQTSGQMRPANSGVGVLGNLFHSLRTYTNSPQTLSRILSSKNTFSSKHFGCSRPTDTVFRNEGLEPFSGEISTAKIIKIERNAFSGHVYNLETSYGYYTAEGIIVGNCLPPKAKGGAPYPTGQERTRAEQCCRQYDRVQDFPAQVVEITLHPASIMREVTPLPLLIKDVEKAASFVRQGYKTILLMGGKAADVFLGYGDNVTRWRGHYEVLTNTVHEWYAGVVGRLAAKGPKAKRTKVPKKGKGSVIDAAVQGVTDPLDTPSTEPPKFKRRKSGKAN